MFRRVDPVIGTGIFSVTAPFYGFETMSSSFIWNLVSIQYTCGHTRQVCNENWDIVRVSDKHGQTHRLTLPENKMIQVVPLVDKFFKCVYSKFLSDPITTSTHFQF